MNKSNRLFLILSLISGLVQAQPTPNKLWEDPTFQNEFLGSYGFLAGAEPPLSSKERAVLRDLINLINNQPQEAIQALRPKTTPESSAAFDFILANLYFQQDDLNQAEQYYQKAVAKHPDFRRAYKNMGLVQIQKGEFDKAIRTISKAIELGEVDGRSYGLLGYGYLNQRKYYPAEAAYRQAILMQPETTDWKLGLARCLLETKRYADAIALFDMLLSEEPDESEYWLLQANAYLGKGDTLAAAKNLEFVRHMGADNLNTLILLGDIYMNEELPDLALDAYLAGTEMATTDDSPILIRAADVLTRTGNYDQSKIMTARIRKQIDDTISNDTDLKLLNIEAKIARAQGNKETAVEILGKIIERDALNGEAIIELANLFAERGEMAKAINRYKQAEKIEAFERDALIAHAQTIVRQRKYKEALPLLRRALQIKSENYLETYTDRVEQAAKSQG